MSKGNISKTPSQNLQTTFKEEFEKFKQDKERYSPGDKYKGKSPDEDFSATEIKWLNELRNSTLVPIEKINLLENEIINLLDLNNELKSELNQTKCKYAALSVNAKKVFLVDIYVLF